ncbi:MAG: protein translocase subunit SecD [Gammaproteobacteria bacterium]|nr:protein translocase subunit SecD [Gammaproteobacteria bacterium]MCG3142761.1 Protein translocase subunit SecD [Gammaproteobacteria bacterium]
MNRTPLWKVIFIIVVVLGALVYAAPNVFREDPSVQISPSRNELVDAVLEQEVVDALKKQGVTPRGVERAERSMLVRLADEETQLKAKDIIAATVGDKYTVALNLASTTPAWLEAVGGKPMYLGLDLRGGVHFLLAIDSKAAVAQAEERFVADLRANFRDEKIRYRTIARKEGGGLTVTFNDQENLDAGLKLLARQYPELQVQSAAGAEPYTTDLRMTDKYILDTKRFAVEQNLTTLRNRVNELGVAEPVIQQQGEDQIVVQLPGVQDTAQAKDILGATATLEFRMVDTEHDLASAEQGRVPPGSKLYTMREGGKVLLQKQVMLTGEYIIDAKAGFDPTDNRPNVSIRLDGKGGALFERATRDNVGKPMAVVFIENKSRTVTSNGETRKVRERVEEVINVATIREQLGRSFQITGLDSAREATNLALLLRAGALAAPMEIVEERTVGPSLGKDNIEKGMISVGIALALVLLFIAWYYRVFGIAADIALLLNLVFLVAIMSLLQATLTLPGIAGIVLTLGMAVDANVLINERILEELRNGTTPQAAIHAGYERAWATILDSNITTLIAGILLFAVGTGPIKGFAVTLCIGILTSMFTAVTISRAVINFIYGGRRVARLSI